VSDCDRYAVIPSRGISASGRFLIGSGNTWFINLLLYLHRHDVAAERREVTSVLLKPIVYARHVEDPEVIGGREPFGPETCRRAHVESLKAEGLMGCPFDPAQSKGSPLYVNPVNMLNILTKVSRFVYA